MTSLQQTAMLGGDASAKVASYVLVAADAGTAISMSNGSATTITVNTGLFAAGDIVTIINLGAGVCTITAGTATVTTSGSLALAQNQGGVLRFTSASAAIFFQFATPASGDIEGVTAGTGISGGGTSGTVTITNSMATEIDAKGDLIVGTGADAFARLAVGTNGHTLVADSAQTTGLKWAAPAGGSTFVGASVYSNTNVSVGHNTYTVIGFNDENLDTDGFHDNSSNNSRLTIPTGKGGKYLIEFWGNTDLGGNYKAVCRLYKNGSAGRITVLSSNGDGAYHFSQVVSAVATDYFEMYLNQNSGTSKNLEGGSTYNWFEISYLGA
jgi:hypothetical protein